jgi:hypothetical protein
MEAARPSEARVSYRNTTRHHKVVLQTALHQCQKYLELHLVGWVLLAGFYEHDKESVGCIEWNSLIN